jgi:hypothetical protein
MNKQDAQRWAANWKAVGEEQRAEAREAPPSAAQSLAHLVTLVEVAIRFQGWPVPDDPMRLREEADARKAWARLRAAYQRR